MRLRGLSVAVGLLIPIAFAAGWLLSRGDGGPSSGGRTVLYWVDPMNPSFRSPEPGTAPCGMPLEPVYAEDAAGGAAASAPAGAVAVRADRLQLIGVAREQVGMRTLRHTVRLVGTVAPDETRLFRITAATAGRIREVGPATTGTLVAKGEQLASFYSAEVNAPQVNYLRILEAVNMPRRPGASEHLPQESNAAATYERNLHLAHQALMNLGMSPEQIAQIGRHHQPALMIEVRAPAAGFIVERNVSLGQSLDVGEQMYAIADLGRVWILADAFEGQERLFPPGTRATVSWPGDDGGIAAVVSDVLPRFDPATRTLKLRLDAPNPGFRLRPGMFVDVELPVEAGPGMFLPKEAVLDSGTRRIVFVESEPGVFAPRAVRTGRRLGDLVEIVAGLMEGETVVVSGNFLLDSESRMRAAGASAAADAAIDPVCGMEVAEAKARSQGLVTEHDGTSWYFCTGTCKEVFDRDPKAAVARAGGAAGPPDVPAPRRAATTATTGGEPADPASAAGMSGHDAMGHQPAAAAEGDGTMAHLPVAAGGHGARHDAGAGDAGDAGRGAPTPVDPVCGMTVDPTKARALGLLSEHAGETWFFCSPECKAGFDADPGAHVPPGR